MKAQYFLSLDKRGEIVMLTEANPPHELLNSQIALTYDEFHVLKAMKGNLKALHKAIHALEKKLEARTL